MQPIGAKKPGGIVRACFFFFFACLFLLSPESGGWHVAGAGAAQQQSGNQSPSTQMEMAARRVGSASNAPESCRTYIGHFLKAWAAPQTAVERDVLRGLQNR